MHARPSVVVHVKPCKFNPYRGGQVTTSIRNIPLVSLQLHGQKIEIALQTNPYLFGLQLAYSTHNCSSLDVDILVGGDFYWDFFSGKMICGTTGPVAMESSLGWVLSGSVDSLPTSHVNLVTSSHTMLIRMSDRDTEIVKKFHEFWDVENVGLVNRDEEVLDNFNKTIQFDGKNYSVRLPFASDPSVL